MRKYCTKHSKILRTMKSRDFAREIIRIKFNHTCQSKKCGKKWKEGMRRFDVHHLKGLCGKKSRKCDSVDDAKRNFTLLCHQCHMRKHTVRSRLISGKLEGVSHSKLYDLIWEGKSYDWVGKKYGVSGAAVYNKVNGRNTVGV